MGPTLRFYDGVRTDAHRRRGQHAGNDAATRDVVQLEDAGEDAPRLDASEDGFVAPDAALRGNCMPAISECPNVAETLEMGTPFQVSGALVQNQADNISSGCGGEGTSDWTLAVTASEAGLLNVRFSSAARYGVEVRRGGCAGSLLSCGVTDGMQTSNSIDAGETYLIAVEASDVCNVDFELTLTLQPR